VSRFILIFVSIIFFFLLIALLSQLIRGSSALEQYESTIIENADSVRSEGVIKRNKPELPTQTEISN
jgi:hypothetical protein